MISWALNQTRQIGFKDETNASLLLCFHRKQNHIRAFYFNVVVLVACEFMWRLNMVVNERGCVCVFASVMIALSYVKMSSCPSVPTSRAETPSSDTQQAELSVEGEDGRWKVQTDVCFPVFLCPHPVFCFLFFCLSFSHDFSLPFHKTFVPFLCPSVFHPGLLYSIFLSFLTLSLSPSFSLSSFRSGLNHRAWWPWERPGPGPQEQDLLQVRSPEEGGQRPPTPWRRQLPGGLEERCGLCRQSLRQGALSQWSLHRTFLPPPRTTMMYLYSLKGKTPFYCYSFIPANRG